MLSTNTTYQSIPSPETSQKANSNNSKWKNVIYAVIAFSALIVLYQFVNPSDTVSPSQTLSVESDTDKVVKKQINIVYNAQELLDFVGSDVAPMPGSAEWREFHDYMIIAMGYDLETVKNDKSISVRFEEHPYDILDLDNSEIYANSRPDGNTKIIRLDHDDVTYLNSLESDAKTWEYQQTLIENAGFDPDDESLDFYFKVSSDDAADEGLKVNCGGRRRPRPTRAPRPPKTPRPKPTRGPKGPKGSRPTKKPTYAPKYDYDVPRTKRCPPKGPNGFVPNRPDCNEGWKDPGMHCFTAHDYVDNGESKEKGEGFTSVECRPRNDALAQIDFVPGTVLLDCGSIVFNSLSSGGYVWNGAEPFTTDSGLPGCRSWQQKGSSQSTSAWCCWPTRDDGEWYGNDIELSTDIITKQKTENDAFCLADEFEDSQQTITAGCAGQQGGTGDNAKAGTMGFLGYTEEKGNCRAVRNDAGYLSLATFRLSVGRTNPDGVPLPRWDCIDVVSDTGAVDCPNLDDGSNHSNYVKVGCSVEWDSEPTQAQCVQGNAFDSSIDFGTTVGVGLTSSNCYAHRVAFDSTYPARAKAKCCRLIPYQKEE